ncbi:chorion protein S15 [Drosophila elegans]|uniref:chorion protein S15 n=1 Tax=Drosophila elegans TaxID=30023 RepID=UPI001BC836F1|nr:chorion protein S15 [Drosophila elegans]
MKYLIVCVTLALFGYLDASPVYGNHGGYGGYGAGGYGAGGYGAGGYGAGGYGGGGYGGGQSVVYKEVPSYGYPQVLQSEGSGGVASASAAASAAALKPGYYQKQLVAGWEIDGGSSGIKIGHGQGYGSHY